MTGVRCFGDVRKVKLAHDYGCDNAVVKKFKSDGRVYGACAGCLKAVTSYLVGVCGAEAVAA